MLSDNKVALEINPKTLAAIFRRKGTETDKTRLAEGGDETAIPNFLSFQEGEHLVLISDSVDGQVILTTHQIVRITADKLLSVPFDLLADACIDFRANFTVGAKDKNSLSLIRVDLIDGTGVFLGVEEGAPYWGILSILKWVAGRNGRLKQD